MGTICPKDFKPCIDDMCRGSDMCALGGGELISKCTACGGLQCDFFDNCTCDPWYQDDEDYDDHNVA